MARDYFVFDKRITGSVIDNKVYESHRDFGLHFFYLGKGYPISVGILLGLEKLGIEMVRIVERTEKGINIYECPLKEYIYGKEFCVGGFERQRCVPLSKMRKVV